VIGQHRLGVTGVLFSLLLFEFRVPSAEVRYLFAPHLTILAFRVLGNEVQGPAPAPEIGGPAPLSPEEPNPLTPFPVKEGGTEKGGASPMCASACGAM
jgi:hypothetical protein